MRIIDNTVIALVVSGEGVLTSEEKSYPLKSGSFIIRQKSIPFSIEITEGTMELWRLSLSHEWYDLQIAQYLGKATQVMNIDELAGPILSYFQACSACLRKQSLNWMDLSNSWFRLIIITAAEKLRFPGGSDSQSRQRYLNICEIIDTKFLTFSSVAEIAQRCNIHPNSMARLFSQFGNESARHRLSRRKVEHTAYLLRQSDKTLQEIAWALGYSDGFSLSRAFKRYFGVAPATYRKQNTT
ncbi:MAG: AraC family transcriptional regulator [Puniceicoccaceae bacterium]